MSERKRETPSTIHPEDRAGFEARVQQEAERSQEAAERKQSARKRLIGSYLGGGLALWNLVREDVMGSAPLTDGQLKLWLAVFAVCFGLASLDQLLTALGKR